MNVLRQAKSTLSNALGMEGGFEAVQKNFPHDLDAGWPDVDEEDAFVIYWIGTTAKSVFVSGMATGSNKLTRERSLAVALVVAAAVEDPTVLDACSEEYAKLVDAAKRYREILEKSPSSVTNSTLTRATTGSASNAATNRSRRDPRTPEETSRRSASYADMQQALEVDVRFVRMCRTWWATCMLL